MKGNFGEALVQAFLSSSKKCLVRQITGNTDIGIDLFCELKDEPNYHFWIQVKTGIKQVKVSRRKGTFELLTFSNISPCKVKYWLSQPVPVFLFGIPEIDEVNFVLNKRTNLKYFYVVDLHKWNQKISHSRSQNKQLKTCLKAELKDGVAFKISKIEDFLRKVPPAVFRTALYNGHIKPIKQAEENIFLARETEPFQNKVVKSMWQASFILASDIYGNYFGKGNEFKPDYGNDNLKEKKKFSKFVELMLHMTDLYPDLKKDSANLSFEALKLALQNDFEGALKKYLKAKNKLNENYKNKKNNKHYKRKKKKYNERIKKLRQRIKE